MGVVYVRVDDKAIQTLFAPGGPVSREAYSIAREAIAIARVRGPKRTGKLVGSLSQAGAMGKFSWSHKIFARAPHARYVIGGTGPRIYPKKGQWLKVPRYPGMALGGKGTYTFKRSVRGQRANPFLQKSVETAMRAHGLSVSFL